MIEIEKPQTLKELQSLTDLIVKTINVKGKFKVIINSRLRASNGRARIVHYIETGRRIIEIGKHYLSYWPVKDLINTIIHEIAHFVQSRTKKLRKYYLKHRLYSSKLNAKHAHTLKFNTLVARLEEKFYVNYGRG